MYTRETRTYLQLYFAANVHRRNGLAVALPNPEGRSI